MWRRLLSAGCKAASNRLKVAVCLSAAGAISYTEGVDATRRMHGNQILHDKHRVALAGWPVHQDKGGNKADARTNTLDGLVQHLKDTGYDGLEMAFKHFQTMYFQDSELSVAEQIKLIRSKFDEHNLQIFGYLTQSYDHDWKDEHSICRHLEEVKQDMMNNKQLGAEYVIFHMFLPEKYQHSDGAYRNDEALLMKYVDRIRTLQKIAYDVGLNFYVETHVFMCTEDPEACSRIIELYHEKYGKDSINTFEINGDLSHYLCRGMIKGPFVESILDKMEHTHVRMARVYGDVSVDVEDPVSDWEHKGVTYDYWNFAKNGMKNGLSSRVVVGESGPYHLVTDPLTQDQRMMPLLRSMAEYCDAQVAANRFDSSNEFNPFKKNANANAKQT